MDLARLLPLEKILWDDVELEFELPKTRQKLALSLTPVGAARVAAQGIGYKNGRLVKTRCVHYRLRLVFFVRYDALSVCTWNCRSGFPARKSSVTGDIPVSLLHALWMQWNLRFSIWLIRYFLKTFVYTPSTPRRDVKLSQNIPLGDLSWKSLTEVMWPHHINGFLNSKIWKKLT